MNCGPARLQVNPFAARRRGARAWQGWAAAFLFLLISAAGAAPATGARGMVASGHPLATHAGLAVLQAGGNAIDAAVAVGLTLGVVDSHNSGIGGGCFLLIRLPSGQVVAIDGRETAPAAATRDLFIRNGKPAPELSQTGPLASGVPGELAAFDHALRHYGRKSLGDLLLPAANLAEQGFTLDATDEARLQSVAKDLARFKAARRVFFSGARPLAQGQRLKQPDLAATYRQIARHGVDWFYRGPFAKKTARWMKANGGLLTAADFANYSVVCREPVSTTYRGCQIVAFPPPGSGGVHLLQMLNILENFDLRAMDDADRWQVMVETMKLAFADRAFWLGDPDFARVPRGLVSKSYAAALAQQIRLDRAAPVPAHGQPPGGLEDAFEKHTTHFSVADAEGNWVACTATINTTFGSKVVIPGTGVVLNNQMDDFSIQPGVPNYFGLVGAEANAIEPRKRPLSSMCPTLVLRDGQPVLALGAAGGPKIISAVLLSLVACLDLGLSPADALAAPRLHHQWSPDELLVEKDFPAPLREALRGRGHAVGELRSHSIAQLVAYDPAAKRFTGVADPRSRGLAAGW
ncbi:MAG TPA: gamma-glutamyltransferase [Candidatus Paceibacterota bacterium]|nr:gamma-glutamyltransferase [Candidatus Paceibacterota bacterium]